MNRPGAIAFCFFALVLSQTGFAASMLLREARSATVRVLTQTQAAQSTDPDALQLQVQSDWGAPVLRLRPNRTLGVLAERMAGRALAYTGEVGGLPGSWAAVTRIGPRWTGIWFDGAHYFGIDDARSLAAISPEVARLRPERQLTFRLADLTSDASFEGDVRIPNAETLAKELQGEPSQPTRVEELATAAAVLPTKRLSVALIADAELASQDGTQTEANMLARLNMVDAIFASQVGVHMQSGSATVLGSGQLFNTTDASTLLTELKDYRSSGTASSLQRASGVSHLFTGRNLDGRTVGIAYISGLCSSSFGASLSEARNTLQYDALIAAHEIGHVFGAPHDGEAASACESTPTAFLMAPQLNGSSTFSACSLEQIAPVVARASCLASYDAADGSIDVPTEVPVPLNAPTDIMVTAQSVGNATLTNASLRITVPSSVTLLSAAGGIAVCSITGQIADCALGDLAPGATQAVTFRVLAPTAGTSSVQLRLTAGNDGLATNNTRSLLLRVSQGTDLAIGGTFDRTAVVIGDSVSAVLTLENRGPADVTDARISVTLPAGLSLLQQTAEGIVCAEVTAGLTCGPQPMAVGATARATLTLRADAAGSLPVGAQVSASTPELQSADNGLQQAITVNTVQASTGSGASSGGGLLSGMALAALGMLTALIAARRQRVAAAK